MPRKGFRYLKAGFGGLVTLPDFRNVSRLFSPGPTLNVEYLPDGLLSRRGQVLSFNLGSFTDVKHGEIFLKADAAARYFLWLMNDDKVYYSQAGTATLLLTPTAGVTLHRIQAYGNRAYIFLSDQALGKQEPKIWDTTNLDSLTVAGQSAGSLAAADGAAGSVTAGVHKLWVIYETRSGFRINSRSGGPSNDGKISVTAAGSKVLDVTGIPVHSDSSVTKKYIAMTAAGLEAGYLATGDLGAAATTATVDIADATLVNQTAVDDYANYKQPGPSGMVGLLYHDRLVLIDGTSRVWVSEPGLPHTFKSNVGYLDVAVDDGDRAVNGFVIRDTLYLAKGQKLYYSQDNGDDPANWPIGLVSDALGTVSPTGLDVDAAEQMIAIADFKGAYIFRGGEPGEISLAIQQKGNQADYSWADVNYANMHKAKVTIDPLNRQVIFLVPTGSDTTPGTVFVADYKEGIKNLKWARWSTAGAAWRGFLTDYRNTSDVALLCYRASSRIVKFSDAALDDDGSALAWNYRFGYFEPQEFGLSLFNEILLKAVGGGSLNFTIYGPDGSSVVTPGALTLAATPGQDYSRQINVVKERIFLEISQTSLTARFKCNRLGLWAKPVGVR